MFTSRFFDFSNFDSVMKMNLLDSASELLKNMSENPEIHDSCVQASELLEVVIAFIDGEIHCD